MNSLILEADKQFAWMRVSTLCDTTIRCRHKREFLDRKDNQMAKPIL